MFQFKLIIAGAAAASLLAARASAAGAPPAKPTGAELAACRTAADQPICLLKLAARGFGHRPYAARIEIGYAPDVLSAIGPEPSDPATREFIERLTRPNRAAIQALIADHAGAAPNQALAAIRAIAAEKARDPADQPKMQAYATGQRIQAYQILWNAGHGDSALPPAHRPSERLTRAALDAWAAELPQAGEDGRAADLAAAFRAIGDARGAERVAPPPPASGPDRIIFLADSGRFDEAVEALGAIKPSEDPMRRVGLLMARVALVEKAVEAGRRDIALRIAEAQLDAWFAEVADPSHRGSAHSGSDVPSSLVLVAQFAPRAEAVKWTERMDAVARRAAPLPAAASAFAAAHAWTRLGEAERARALLDLWPAPSETEIRACVVGMFKISPECQKSPGVLLAFMLKSAPLDASWDELAPMTGPMVRAKREAARGIAGVEADLAKATTVEARFLILQNCARSGGEDQPLPITAECARRLASAPAPEETAPRPEGRLSYGERRLDGALWAARQAAQVHDLKTMGEMLDLSFALAARTPDEQVDLIASVEDIAIAELRAAGRL